MVSNIAHKKGQAQVKWTRSMKLAVHLLYTEQHYLPKEERTAIFNCLFARELAVCRLPEGASASIVSAQWGERNKGNRDWLAICHSQIDAVDAHARDCMRERVQQTIHDRCGSTHDRRGGTHDRRGSTHDRDSVATPITPRGQGSSTNTTFREALSRAVYTTPTTPPPSNMRLPKRSLDDASDSDEDSPSPKRTTIIKQKAIVVIPRTPLGSGLRTPLASGLRTPLASGLRTPLASGSRRLASAKSPRVPTLMNNGKTVMLTERQAEKRATRSEPVDRYRAHPPMKGLLFRVWEEDPACDRDSRQGHHARKYWRKNAVPNNPPSSLDPTDVLNHMDREMTDGPFISTCSRLVWTIQLMLKDLKAGKNACISVINAAALDRRSIFHARPYHDDLVNMAAFTNGAWRYHGSHEYLIFKQIPAEAIMHVFRAQDLIKVAADVEAIGAALQLEILLVLNKSLIRKILMMKKNNVGLSLEITGGIAELCIFFGLDAHSPVDHLSHIVSDVVEGCALSVKHHEEDEWYHFATIFASRLCQLSPQPGVLFKEQEAAKFAFLNGVAWGCGDPNAALKPELVAKKQRKATAVGLSSPARICANALDAAKLSVLAFEKAHNTRLDRYHRRLHSTPTSAGVGNGGVGVAEDHLEVETDMEGSVDGGSDEDDTLADDSDDEIVFTDRQLGL